MGESKGTTLAIGILLFWLAGVAFWIAFGQATKNASIPAGAGAGGALGVLGGVIHDVTESQTAQTPT